MSLELYNQKRDFNQTTEPKGVLGAPTERLQFVVQRHEASRLHYDFRLELNGVLKSWAVPKGPSLYPKDKRLAVMVEDHPYEYKNFEGIIPVGNYGAGRMKIWDSGYFEHLTIKGIAEAQQALTSELQTGSIKIVLYGQKLRGSFGVVKIKNSVDKNAWLLIKQVDEFATLGPYHSEDFID